MNTSLIEILALIMTTSAAGMSIGKWLNTFLFGGFGSNGIDLKDVNVWAVLITSGVAIAIVVLMVVNEIKGKIQFFVTIGLVVVWLLVLIWDLLFRDYTVFKLDKIEVINSGQRTKELIECGIFIVQLGAALLFHFMIESYKA